MTDYFKDYKTIETWQVTVFDKTKKPYYLQSFAEEVEDILYGKQDPAYKFETREEAEAFLKEAEAKLDARLVEQDRYFANPENKAKWEKERQDNLVNERFCW